MIRPSVAERGFAFALIASAAVHAALLPLILSPVSGSAPVHVQPIEGICITAFLVPEAPAAPGKAAVLPPLKLRETDRAEPSPAAPAWEAPQKVAPPEQKETGLLADIRPAAEQSGTQYDAGKSPEKAATAAPVVLIREAVNPSGSGGSGIPAAGRGSGGFSRENDTDRPASPREGTGVAREGSGVWSMRDAAAAPRYGDNALPTYPPLARLRGYQGVAVLSVEVLADGGVGRVGISRSTGHEILDRTALEAVRSWKFEPARREGRPVAMSVEVPVRFVLKGHSTLVRMDERR